MRIHIKTSGIQRIVPYDHQHLLTGTIHKWLGQNNEHGSVSLYSFSRLAGGKATPQGIHFERGTSFYFSASDVNLIKRMIEGIRTTPGMFAGLTVTDVAIQEDPDLSVRELFHVGSPIFIKRRDGNKIEHVLYDDKQAGDFLKETLQTKMELAGVANEPFQIRFDTNYLRPSIKKITYKGIANKANWCPVIIEGSPEVKLFAWNVGLGNSTGIGFGAIK
ncbi:MAG: CRISPR-associated endoribonuclease Cas6 [Breznakibacter sp.]